MKVIFLDFDGVITTQDSGFRCDLTKMNMIKSLCDRTGAKIVISSSWRSHSLESTINRITKEEIKWGNQPYTLVDYTIGITPRCGVTYTSPEGELIHESCPRGKEIDIWLSKHNYWKSKYKKFQEEITPDDVTNYVIFDDDNFDMLISQEEHYIKTDTYAGVSEQNIEKAYEILTKE